MDYSAARKMLLREAFVMEEVKIFSSPVFVGYGYVLHAGREWRGEHCIRHHSNLIRMNHDLADAIAFAYGDSIPLGAERHSLAVQKGLAQQVENSDDQPRLIQGSDRSSESKSSDLELSMFMLDAVTTPKDE